MWRSPRRLAAAPALLLVLPAACSGGSGGGGGTSPLPASLAQRFPIDGEFDFADLPAPEQALLEFEDENGTPTGKLSLLRWSVLNDDRHLYVALEWDDDTYDHTYDLTNGPTDFDGVKLFFDADGDGVWEGGEDARSVLAASIGSLFLDQHAAAGDETDLVGDGRGQLVRDDLLGLYRAELLIPLGDDAAGEDGVLDSASRYEVILYDHVDPLAVTGNVAALHAVPSGPGADAAAWDDLPHSPAGLHARPELPDDLQGLIVFLSDHENPKRDVYAFDPATRTTTRVTEEPGLFKDNLSLSHDRTRVAFHGAPEEDDFDGYEIWAVDVDGSELQQLTDNTWLDGHPAWSPDDQRIAYASRRGSSFSVVVMTADGTEIADLTPSGVDDNDPEYLPDGRIVFKTSRFGALPEVEIAVMDEDGTNVEQLSFADGVSDHDPAGDGTSVFFERFPKDTLYATDPESGFVGWPLVEAPLDGSGESVLVEAGGDILWLPVPGPSGRYLVHLRTAGYTEARLVTREGEDLGRLVPGVTRLRYVDWK